MAARTHVALLRAINVGGRNSLPMKDLAAICEAAGCKDVVTYIQSGNVAFGASAALAKKLPAVLEKAILAKAGIRVPVIVRTAAELAAVARANPYVKAGALEEAGLHVGFLADEPTKERIAMLDPKRSPPDEFVVRVASLHQQATAAGRQVAPTIRYTVDMNLAMGTRASDTVAETGAGAGVVDMKGSFDAMRAFVDRYRAIGATDFICQFEHRTAEQHIDFIRAFSREIIARH